MVEEKIIREAWTSIDKTRKLLGIFGSPRLLQDWKAAKGADIEPTWDTFLTLMQAYYKPTENHIIRNYEFRQLTQKSGETFSAFCNRVEAAAKNCSFCDCAETTACTATAFATRDQIVIGTNNEGIREKAMMKDWSLQDLRKKGMKHESAATDEEIISGTTSISKIGSYLYNKLKKNRNNKKIGGNETEKRCFHCNQPFYQGHLKKCKVIDKKCSNCQRTGHFAIVCRQKDAKKLEATTEESEEEADTYRLNIFKLKTSQSIPQYSIKNRIDFKSRVVVNNRYTKILVDTGAKVSVCGMKQARAWGLLDKMIPSWIHPYNSPPIPIRGTARCAVTFKERSVPVEFDVLPGSWEPILAGNQALQLRIITFDGTDDVYNPVLMIDNETSLVDNGKFSKDIEIILSNYNPHNFKGLGKLKDCQVKLYTDKPVVVPPRVIPYHLEQRANDAIQKMLNEGVIEKLTKIIIIILIISIFIINILIDDTTFLFKQK